MHCPVDAIGLGGAGVFADKLYFDPAGGWLEGKAFGLDARVYMSLIGEVFQRFTGPIPWKDDFAQKVKLGPNLLFKPYPNLIAINLQNYRKLTDGLVKLISKKGAKVLFSKKVVSITVSKTNNQFTLGFKNGNTIYSDIVVLATGRGGTQWLKHQAKHLRLHIENAKPYVGVRIETLSSRVKKMTELSMDPKIKSTLDDTKIHCVTTGGHVMSCKCDGMVLVDGTKFEPKSSNTSFNVLTRLGSGGSEYGRRIINRMLEKGRGIPIIQRMEDFRSGFASSQKSILAGSVKATLKAAAPGDITDQLPDKVQERIINFISELSKFEPGVTAGDNLVYAPVFEWFYPTVNMNPKTWKTSVDGFFVAGDAAGHSQGVVMACASGVRVASAVQEYLALWNGLAALA